MKDVTTHCLICVSIKTIVDALQPSASTEYTSSLTAGITRCIQTDWDLPYNIPQLVQLIPQTTRRCGSE